MNHRVTPDYSLYTIDARMPIRYPAGTVIHYDAQALHSALEPHERPLTNVSKSEDRSSYIMRIGLLKSLPSFTQKNILRVFFLYIVLPEFPTYSSQLPPRDPSNPALLYI